MLLIRTRCCADEGPGRSLGSSLMFSGGHALTGDMRLRGVLMADLGAEMVLGPCGPLARRVVEPAILQ